MKSILISRLMAASVVLMSLTISAMASAIVKPKFFLCPAKFIRDATVITERYDANLCSRTIPQGNPDLSTYTIIALRNRLTKKQINLPVTTKDDIVYIGKSVAGVTYKFDFNQRLLTIRSKPGQVTTEKIISSD